MLNSRGDDALSTNFLEELDGLDGLDEEDFHRLLFGPILLLAERGNGAAQAALGEIYLSGLAVKTDYAKAKENFELSAKNGCSRGLCGLGIVYLYGLGTERNLIKAWELFNMAAALNDGDAYYYLSFFHRGFFGSQPKIVKKNLTMAAYMLEDATNLGCRFAPYTLAVHYLKLKGKLTVSQKFSKAKPLLLEASKREDPRADLLLGVMTYEGVGSFRQSRPKAFKYWEKADTPQCIFLMAQCYMYGKGVKRNLKTACEYYELSARMGFEPAQYTLACVHYTTDKPDFAKALHWFEKSAQKGNPKAMLSAAAMYKNGKGCVKNLDKAVEYIKLAHEHGDPDASCCMGSLYYCGQTVEADLDLAKDYFAIAAERGHVTAAYVLGQLYYYDKERSDNLTMAAHWYRKSGNNAYNRPAEINFSLGCIELHFHNYETAFEYFDKAAHQWHTPSQYNLAIMYITGIGTEVDYNLAQIYLDKALWHGLPDACFALGYMHYQGLGTPRSAERSLPYFETAQRCHHAQAAYYLGRMYYYGNGVAQNYKSACRYYRCAAVLGHAQACFEVGLMYMIGEGCNQNFQEAEKFLTMSLKGGFNAAAVHLELVTKLKKEFSDKLMDKAALNRDD